VQHHDGQVDVTLLGTKVTISNNAFMRHDKAEPAGRLRRGRAGPGYGPGKIDVTFHGNYFRNMIQRIASGALAACMPSTTSYEVDRNANAHTA